MNNMNYQDKINMQKEILGLFRANYSQGTVKLTKGENRLHRQVKCDVVGYLLDNGFKVWTEATLKYGGRPDIVCMKGHIAYIIEVTNTEKEKSIINKRKKYPNIPIIVVNVKDFKYEEFCL